MLLHVPVTSFIFIQILIGTKLIENPCKSVYCVFLDAWRELKAIKALAGQRKVTSGQFG